MAEFIKLYNPTEEEDLESDFKKIMEGFNLPIKFLPHSYFYDENGSKIIT